MAATIDPDQLRAASLRNMAAHLTGPLASGATDAQLAIDEQGRARMELDVRSPLLVVAPSQALGGTAMRVSATVDAGGGPETPGPLTFAPHTEAGASLPLWWSQAGSSGPLDIELSVDGAAPADVAGLVQLRVVGGVLGRLLFIAAAEKARVRREARVLAAMRLLALARDDALDRFGADLGIPRLTDRLVFDAGKQEIVGVPEREGDDAYRRRLALYRPWLRATRQRVTELVESVDQRLSVVDEFNPFAVAIHLLSVDDEPGWAEARRAAFLDHVRRVHLLWPLPDGDAVHAARYVSADRQAADNALRQELRTRFEFTGDAQPEPALAPRLASALVLAARCRDALGLSASWPVLRVQKGDAGSRYELGLGADVKPLTAAELDALIDAHRTRAPSADPEIEALLSAITPAPRNDDPDGRWLLEPCGLTTLHRVNQQRLYVSHLPAFGLAITAPSVVQPGGWAQILAGDFADRSAGGLVFYDRSAGAGEVYASDGGGALRLAAAHPGWRTTWTHIVKGKFAPGRHDALLFYDRAAGGIEIYAVDGRGGISLVSALTGYGTSFTHLIPARLTRGGTGLVLYDRAAGRGELHAGDGAGGLTLQLAHPGWRTSWSQIVAGDFSAGAFDDLLFYDRFAGVGELYATDGKGGARLLARYEGWRRSWSHIVALREKGRDLLLFYERDTGVAEIYAPDGAAGLQRVRRLTLGADWETVVPGDAGVLLYNRGTGAAELRALRPGGRLDVVRRYAGWRRAAPVEVEGHYLAPGDSAKTAVLEAGLTAAAAAWAAKGGEPWARLTDSDAHARWSLAVNRAKADGRIREAGLPVLAAPDKLAARLALLPDEVIETIALGPDATTAVLGGLATGRETLRAIAAELRAQHLAAVLPVVTSAGEVLLVVGAIGLPEAGLNLSDRRATGLRWYTVPLGGGAGATVKPVGVRTSAVPGGRGLIALVAVGYARRGLVDPYEYRVEMTEGATLDLAGYELLMNLLERAHPAGVEVNTYTIRTEHVDLAGTNSAQPLPPKFARTYRTFRRLRARGATTGEGD